MARIRSNNSNKTVYKVPEEAILKLECASCGEALHSDDVNINKSLAKCSNCQTVMSLDNDLFFQNDVITKPEYFMPEGTDVLELGDSLDIRINWQKSASSKGHWFLKLFTIMWNFILIVIGAGILASGAGILGLLPLAIHGTVGIVLGSYLLAHYLNYTDVIVTNRMIEISQRPIKNPFKSTLQIRANEIKQLYVNKYVSSTTNGVPNHAFALWAILRNGKKVKLIGGMNRETQLYIEQEIERFLAIDNDESYDSQK